MSAGRVVVAAPAKLTLSLRVTGVRSDGLHELDAEMVSIDLADELVIDAAGEGLQVVAEPEGDGLETGAANLVSRALAAVDRLAGIRLVKRIPVGGGLGGGSSDAAAVLRWAGCADLHVAARLGSDVPFCVRGGHARVSGIGERVEVLEDEPRSFVLLVPPMAVDTAAVYRAYDELALAGRVDDAVENELTAPALRVAPDLGRWRDALGELTGRTPQLAGSGATWFVEGTEAELGLIGARQITLGDAVGRLLPVRTVDSSYGSVRPVG